MRNVMTIMRIKSTQHQFTHQTKCIYLHSRPVRNRRHPIRLIRDHHFPHAKGVARHGMCCALPIVEVTNERS